MQADSIKEQILPVLRKAESITAPQLASQLGASIDKVEDELEVLLGQYPCHLSGNDKGELFYHFDFTEEPKSKGFWKKLQRRATRWGKAGFKVWIALMIYGYIWAYLPTFLVLYLAGLGIGGLLVAPIILLMVLYAVIADVMKLPDVPTSYWRWIKRFLWGRTQRRMGRNRKKVTRFFHQKVFGFVFGDKISRGLDSEELERLIARYISQNKQVLTTGELALIKGVSLGQAEKDIVKLMTKYRGTVSVTSIGTLLYHFPELPTEAPDPQPWYIWQRLPLPQPYNQNFITENSWVTLLIGTVALSSFSSLIFTDDLVFWENGSFIGSHVFPALFSAIFIGISIAGRVQHWRHNFNRVNQCREALLLHKILKNRGELPELSQSIWKRLASKYDGDIKIDEGITYQFPDLQADLRTAAYAQCNALITPQGYLPEALTIPANEDISQLLMLTDHTDIESIRESGLRLNIDEHPKGYDRYIEYYENGIDIVIPPGDQTDASFHSMLFGGVLLGSSIISAIILLSAGPSPFSVCFFLAGVLVPIPRFISALKAHNTRKVSVRGDQVTLSAWPINWVSPPKTFSLRDFGGLRIQRADPRGTFYDLLLLRRKASFAETLSKQQNDRRLLEHLRNALYIYIQERNDILSGPHR